MSEVTLSTSGPPETVLDTEPAEVLEALADALVATGGRSAGGHRGRRRAAGPGSSTAGPGSAMRGVT